MRHSSAIGPFIAVLALAACSSDVAPPTPSLASARGALTQGCDCADGTWDLVDQGTSASLNVVGKSLCIDSGTFSGQLQMDAGTRVCVDDDAAYVSAQALNLGGTFENWGVAGTAETPFSFSAIEGTVIANHGAMHIATANFNGRADISNAVDATIDFTTSFSLRNRSSMSNLGTFRAVSNFDTSSDSTFVNEGYGYITGQLSFEGLSENHGLLEITAKVNVNGQAEFANTCTIVSHGTYNVNGKYANDGLVYLYADSEDLHFNVTGGGAMTQGPQGQVIVTSQDGPGSGRQANLRIDGSVSGEGLFFVEDETVCQGSGTITGTAETPFIAYDATPTGLINGNLLDVQTGILSNVARGDAPAVPALVEAQLGITGSDCRTLVALHCYDDHPPSEVDTGCDETRPWCLIEGETRRCVGCVDAEDCDGGECVDGVCTNLPPVAVNDRLAVAEGGSVTVTASELGANDHHIAIATLRLPNGVTSFVTLGGGTVTMAVDGGGARSFTYVPAATGAPAADTFRYEVCGAGTAAAQCVTAVVTVDINHRPAPDDVDVWVAVGDESATVDVLSAFADPDGDGPDEDVGVIVVDVPQPNVPGRQVVAYPACDDGLPSACGAGEIIIHVNDPPVLTTSPLIGGAGQAVTIPLETIIVSTGVVHGDDPSDGDTDGIGTVTVTGSGCALVGDDVHVTSPASPGTTTCDVTVCEERPASTPAVCATTTLTIVRPPAPVAADDEVESDEDELVVIVVDANDDPTLTVVAVTTTPAHGTVDVNEDGSISYVPNADFHGSDIFEYRACDSHGQCDTATVSVTVTSQPDAPIAADDAATTQPNTAVTIPLTANDTDADGDALTVTNMTNPAHGTVTASGTTGAVYTPEPGFRGSETFDYTVCDADGLCDTAHVTVTVGDNRGPVGGADHADVDEDGTATIDVLDNDADPDGDDLEVTEVSDPDHGTAVLDEDGTIVYTPDPDYAGDDTFTYVVCDAEGACATVTVTLTVTPENDPPVAIDDHYTTPRDAMLEIEPRTNDIDVDGDELTILSFTTSAHGAVDSTVATRVKYVPEAGFVGTVTFEYVVSDPGGLTDTATITVDITDVVTPNQPPEAVADSAEVPTGGSVTIDVTGNDTDPDGDSVELTSVGGPEHGSVTINPDGSVSYTPDPGFSGTDTFSYTISDSHGHTAGGTVTVVVTAGDDLSGIVAEGGGGCASGGASGDAALVLTIALAAVAFMTRRRARPVTCRR